ncbi:MAG: FliH/SctL family protein [bacterium]
MSNIIRQANNAPTVYVGERQLNFDREQLAETKLSELFPVVSVTTDADGAKFIPIEEVFNLEKLHRDACLRSFEDGHKKGYAAGLKEGLKKAEDVMNKFDSAINDAVSQRQQMLEESKQRLLELVIQISKKVTFDAIEINPEATLKMISGVVDSLLDRSRIKILVNPDHLTIVEQNINTYLKGSTAIKELAIVPDARIRYGGCFIETPNGDIDARLESQFEILEDALLINEAES